MTLVKINNTEFEAIIQTRPKDFVWNDRESKAITLKMTYAEALETFVDDLKWSIINKYTDDYGETQIEEIDMSIYSLAGSITDNRDGTITVKMGKSTAEELLNIFKEALKL